MRTGTQPTGILPWEVDIKRKTPHSHPLPHHRAHNPLALNSQRSCMTEKLSFTSKVKTVKTLKTVKTVKTETI
jgi:hypothetical protein